MKYTLPVILMLALHMVLLRIDAYSAPHVDSFMHFAGGITLGVLACGVLSGAVKLGWILPPGRLLLFVLIFSLVTTGAVFWEFFEWSADTIMGTRMQLSIGDTMKDLLLGQFGAIVCAFAVINPFEKRSPVLQDPMGSEFAPVKTTH